MTGAKEAQTKLPKFWIAATEATTPEGAIACTRHQHEFPARYVKKSAMPMPHAAPVAPGMYGTSNVEMAEHVIPVTRRALWVLIGGTPWRMTKSAITPLMNMPIAPKKKGMIAIVPVAATLK